MEHKWKDSKRENIRKLGMLVCVEGKDEKDSSVRVNSMYVRGKVREKVVFDFEVSYKSF